MNLREAFIDCVFPPTCAACRRPGRAPFCLMCTEALLPASPARLPGFAAVRVEYQYGGPLALALYALKYDNRPEVGPVLGRGLCRAWPKDRRFDVVLPVPSTPRRLRTRGYNPARELARGFGGKVRCGRLKRIGEPTPQVGLPLSARLSNPQGSFRATGVSGARVLLVDDVLTTGATLLAACDALVRAGASEVMATVLARVE